MCRAAGEKTFKPELMLFFILKSKVTKLQLLDWPLEVGSKSDSLSIDSHVRCSSLQQK